MTGYREEEAWGRGLTDPTSDVEPPSRLYAYTVEQTIRVRYTIRRRHPEGLTWEQLASQPAELLTRAGPFDVIDTRILSNGYTLEAGSFTEIKR